ncbi:hypothetical protein [Psychroflexus sp. MES1-P1E]|uniref:hypothetical protein n=1 Tax=Psychroflexus sp. MES1-P1E TaxID=2058320 RepID=UPI000C797E78|nr:hypothetical protein [Psychroflexus sp. MES1-P1E]PKG43427.1 hypothetical protein CXF67_05015 [Psychroflexus sp. MES1-P1E]
MQHIKKIILNNLVNIPGWRTNRKIVVIESDDWGSIRMPSNVVFQNMFNAKIPVDKDLYSIYDSLESNDDLSALFDTLKKVKDKNNNNPVITANTIVGNPDFEKIKKSNFSNYYFETFNETLKRYPNHNKVFKLYEQGIEENIFRPQFHGREHLNTLQWMNELQSKNENLLLAFEHQMFGIPIKDTKRGNYMAAFDFDEESNLVAVQNTIVEGLKIFSNLFGYQSKTLIAPCYVWSNKMDSVLNKEGIKGYQGIRKQFVPNVNGKAYKKKYHYTGQPNALGQKYLVRNAFFEPTHFSKKDEIKEILERMRISFFWKKPLILSTHRINFIGSLNEKNRKINLQKFEILLKSIVKEFPDVEFMSSDKLLELMLNEND